MRILAHFQAISSTKKNIPTTLYKLPETTAWVFDIVNHLMIEVYSSISEQEREQIIKRTVEGMRAAAAKGRRAGRSKLDADKLEIAIKLYNLEGYIVAAICEKLGIFRALFHRYVNQKIAYLHPYLVPSSDTFFFSIGSFDMPYRIFLPCPSLPLLSSSYVRYLDLA